MIALLRFWPLALFAVLVAVAGVLWLRLDAAQQQTENAELREQVLRDAHAETLRVLDQLESDRRQAETALAALQSHRQAEAQRARRITREITHATPADRAAADGLRSLVDGL